MIISFNLIYNLNLFWIKQNFSRSYKLLHVFWNTLYSIDETLSNDFDFVTLTETCLLKITFLAGAFMIHSCNHFSLNEKAPFWSWPTTLKWLYNASFVEEQNWYFFCLWNITQNDDSVKVVGMC